MICEPDAHLEILRRRQIYDTLSEVAQRSGAQVIAASHSEVLLNEAALSDVVIAFVGKPHRIDDRGSQAAKALKSIGFEDYCKAEETGWVIYLEGATDLAILQAFARTLGHGAAELLQRPFAHYIGNQPNNAWEHFYGVKKAKADLVGPILKFLTELGLPNLMRKSDYHRLAALVPREGVAPEVTEVLDAIVEVAGRARPLRDEDEA